MGLSSTASQNRPDAGRRSIRSAFLVTVVVPAAVLVVLWLACAGLMASSATTGHGYLAQHPGVTGITVAIIGTLVIIAVVALTASFARRLARDVAGLAVTAQRLTAQPVVTGRDRGGALPELDQVPHAPRRATAEVASAGAALVGLQSAAATAASSEASLRNGLREVFVSMARRNQSLLQRQLRLIDALEQKASDPAALADLFSLDHLTTRMRRHAESLAILSGAAPGRAWREPVPVIDVIRGAMAEVEDYKRVSVLTRSEDSITGAAVADMIHLLAELIENATLFSPSGTRVEVRAGRVANGFAVEIDDRGLGVEPEQLAEINRQLASPPDFDLANADRLGLFVGGKLAARHGVRVSLRTSPYGGTTAIVLMPNGIVVAPPGTLPDGMPPDASPAELAAGRPAGLDLDGTESRAVTGRHTAPAADDRLATTASNGSLSGPPNGGRAADDLFPGGFADRAPTAPAGQAPPLPTRRSATRATTGAASPAAAPATPVSAPGFPDPSRSGTAA
ncbi:MAG: sensor histidine kinase, partial [Streptosporangiaceae bacterium]